MLRPVRSESRLVAFWAFFFSLVSFAWERASEIFFKVGGGGRDLPQGGGGGGLFGNFVVEGGKGPLKVFFLSNIILTAFPPHFSPKNFSPAAEWTRTVWLHFFFEGEKHYLLLEEFPFFSSNIR